jgi:hypothetical protein
MRVELTRYRVKPGKSARVDEWLQTLTDRREECLITLEREKMKVEAIFREQIGDNDRTATSLIFLASCKWLTGLRQSSSPAKPDWDKPSKRWLYRNRITNTAEIVYNSGLNRRGGN